MKFKIIDKEKKGFARYCPTFARGYEVMREGVIKLRIKRLVKKLGNEDWKVRKNAAEDLENVALKGTDINIAIPALAKALGDECDEIWEYAAKVFGIGAANAKSKGVALNALINSLGDEDAHVRSNAAYVLRIIANRGENIPIAIPVLAKALGDDDKYVRREVWNALEAVVCEAKYESRIVITKAMMDLTNSSWLMREMEKNSDVFIDTVKNADLLLRKIDSLERKQAQLSS